MTRRLRLRLRLLPLALLLLASQATAEPWTCWMTVQCDNIDCFAIDDTYTVIAADHEGQLFLTSPVGPRPATRLSPPGTLPAAYGAAGPQAVGELLTIAGDGAAIYTAHGGDGPARTRTVFGTCSAL